MALATPILHQERIAQWAHWSPSIPYTIGIEEEVMILDPVAWVLANEGAHVLSSLSGRLQSHISAETHQAAIELASSPHSSAEEAGREAAELRQALSEHLVGRGFRAAAAGTHPFATWVDMKVTRGARYQLVYETMRELARREPTFALHVHVGVSDPEAAIHLLNRMRAHLPLLLALSANSPFWQGRDAGLASTRTPIFQAFPRTGIPRAFSSYGEYVRVIEQLIRCQAFPEPTFLWWDVRLQPGLGTVEVRIMDVQSTSARTAALAALVQAIARLELEEGYCSDQLIGAPEVLDENRFLAARDGMAAQLIDPDLARRTPAREQLARLLDSARGHAQDLGSEAALEIVASTARAGGAEQQRQMAGNSSLRGMMECLAGDFARPG